MCRKCLSEYIRQLRSFKVLAATGDIFVFFAEFKIFVTFPSTFKYSSKVIRESFISKFIKDDYILIADYVDYLI